MLQENLNVFFDKRFGGVDATVAGAPVVGNFSNEYVEVDNGVAPVVGLKPVLAVKSSDAVGAVTGTDVTVEEEEAGVVVRTGTYKVIIQQPDGTGVTILILEKQ